MLGSAACRAVSPIGRLASRCHQTPSRFVQARYWKCLQGLQVHIPMVTRPLPAPAHPSSAEAAAEPQDDEMSDVRDDDEDQASGGEAGLSNTGRGCCRDGAGPEICSA